MPTNNFKLFDENKANMMSDTEYNKNTQRLNGVQAGVASSQLQNKTLYQTSLISYAIAQFMNEMGFDASDSIAVSTFVNNLTSSVKKPSKSAVRYTSQSLNSTQKAQAISNIGAATVDHNHYGRVIEPTSVELFPGSSAGHGGYIDFHFNNDSADYTSRLLEPVKGVLQYNGHGIISTANITAIYNANATFKNGVATYNNSAIKSNSVCFAQWRAGAVSTLVDSVLSTTSGNGAVTIIAKGLATTPNSKLPLNLLIINL